jgi:hypothetical protein
VRACECRSCRLDTRQGQTRVSNYVHTATVVTSLDNDALVPLAVRLNALCCTAHVRPGTASGYPSGHFKVRRVRRSAWRCNKKNPNAHTLTRKEIFFASAREWKHAKLEPTNRACLASHVCNTPRAARSSATHSSQQRTAICDIFHSVIKVHVAACTNL